MTAEIDAPLSQDALSAFLQKIDCTTEASNF